MKTEWLDGRHVVFGQIVDGMDVVQKVTRLDPFLLPACQKIVFFSFSTSFSSTSPSQIEGLGSRSGKTSRKVVVEDCGEID